MKRRIVIAGFTLAILILFAIVVMSILFPNERTIEEVHEATLLLEDGSTQPCSVRFSGKLVSKPSGSKLAGLHGLSDGGIFINDIRVVSGYPFWDPNDIYPLGAESGIFYLNKDLSVFAAKVQTQMLFPDLAPQTAYIVLNSNTPEQYQPILKMLKDRAYK